MGSLAPTTPSQSPAGVKQEGSQPQSQPQSQPSPPSSSSPSSSSLPNLSSGGLESSRPGQHAGNGDTQSSTSSDLQTSTSQPTAGAAPAAAMGGGGLQELRRVCREPIFASFVAGGVAGAVSRTVVSPLERLKILFQIQTVGREDYKMSIGKALGKMWREEGLKGFMRGNGTNCVRIVPYSAVQFGSYNFYKRFFEEPGHDLSQAPLRRLVCGGLAGITSVTFTYPLDIVRTRLSIQTASIAGLQSQSRDGAARAPPGMWQTMVLMYKTEGGWKALYRGIAPTVAGVAPYVGLNFMVYEWARGYMTKEGDKNPSTVGKLAAGAFSGAVAQSCTYPFDVLRRRFQINTMSGMGYQYKSIWDAIRIIITQEGVKGMYKGLTPNLLKVAPSMASSWASFELTRDYIIAFGNRDVDA